ncbi:MAG: ribosomal protein S18-alanine N-acetyltransferase [Lachnospiraceae bacterium]|nr:ribosomal protein S18-alanine N-acetyltransferase [Lachnospiraceae bacterium]
MTWDDVEQVAAIEAACFGEYWSASLLEEGLARDWNLFLVTEENGCLTGYGAACVIAGEGEIQRIAVLKEFRRMGTGRKLLDALINASRERGAGAMTLEVRESNEAARNLYLSAGFQEEARRKDYYRNPTEAAVIMWNRKI